MQNVINTVYRQPASKVVLAYTTGYESQVKLIGTKISR